MLRGSCLHKLLALAIALVAASASANTIRNNADVIALLKAGIGEVAILHAIDSSNPSFDTSAAALIALKQSGASDTIIRRVIATGAPQRTPSGAPATGRSGGTCIDDDSDGRLGLMDEGRMLRVRRAKSNAEVAVRGGTVMGHIFSLGFAPLRAKVRVVIPGERAEARLSGNQPSITSIGIRTDATLDEIGLVRLQIINGNRYVDVGEGSTSVRGSKAETKFLAEALVELEFTPKQKGCTHVAQGGATFTMNIFSARTKSPLPPGEYALVLAGGDMVFDFGVDQ